MPNWLMQALGAIYTRIPPSMRPTLKRVFLWTQIRVEGLLTGRKVMRGQRIEFVGFEIADLAHFEFLSPGPGEVQVESLFSTVSPGTESAVLCGLPGARRSFPYVPGYSCAGRVTRVGKGVRDLRVGQLVAGRIPHVSQYTVGRSLVFPVPDGVSPEAASFMELGIITLQGMRKARIAPGDHVAVLGQGLIGQMANRLARMLAAGRVTAIAPSRSRSRTAVAAGGADEFLAMRDPEFAALRVQADVVVEAVGTPDAVRTAMQCSRHGGRVVLLGSARGLTRDIPLGQLIAEKELSVIGAHISDMPDREASPGRHTYHDEGRLFLDLLQQQRLSVDELVTWRASPRECNAVYESLAHGGGGHVAIVFDWNRLTSAVSATQS